MKWYGHFGKSLVIMIKFDLCISCVTAISLLGSLHGCIFRELCAHMLQKMHTSILIAVLFAVADN